MDESSERSATRSPRRGRTINKKSMVSVSTLVFCGLSWAVGFYSGLSVGIASKHNHTEPTNQERMMESFRHQQSQNCSCIPAVDESPVPECPTSTSSKEQLTSIPPAQQQRRTSTSTTKQSRSLQFPKQVRSFAVGMTRVDRDEFAGKFDMGVPLDESLPKNKQVLILHGRQDAIPKSMPTVQNSNANANDDDDGIHLLSVDDATASCDFLNVVLTDDSGDRRQCLAIMGQFESYHVQRFMRIGPKGPLDQELPLRYVQR
jgi:hypothetical protein